MQTLDADIRHTNYILKNPLFSTLLENFLNSVGALLESINGIGKNGLDAGCGEGHMLGCLHDHGAFDRLTAMDINPEHLCIASKQFPCFDYHVVDIRNLSFINNTCDFFMSAEVFEHLPHPGKALIELKKIEKLKAYLIISVLFEPFFNWGNLLCGKYWERGGYNPDPWNFWHFLYSALS